MGAGLAIAGTVAAVAVLDRLSSTEKDHDDVLEDTYQAVESAAASRSSIYVDHINVDADGNPRSALPGEDHILDLVLTGFADNNLVVEVETADTLDQTALDQLADFSTKGYRRVLVVPDGAVDDGAQLLEDTATGDRERVVVCGPTDVADLL